MAIPSSGPISIGDFNTALSRASNTANSKLAGASTPTTDSLVYLAGQVGTLNQSAPHAFSEWYGYGSIISFVGSAQSTGTSITLPSGLQQNDIVIVCSMSDTTSQNLPSGFNGLLSFTYINGQNGNANDVFYRWSYRRMGADVDTAVTNLSSSSVHIAIIFRNVNTTTAIDATAGTVGSGTTGMPNPPSVTTVTNNAMVIAMGFLDDDLVTATAPTNYTLARTANYGSAGNGGTVMAAYRLRTTAGAEDPGVFGGGGTDSWIGATTSLRPV